MVAGAAGDGLLRGMFEGCIAGGDMGIQRRPYHKNCKCALHKSRNSRTHSSQCGVVSYPVRRTWSEGCLALMNPAPALAAALHPPAPPQNPPQCTGGLAASGCIHGRSGRGRG